MELHCAKVERQERTHVNPQGLARRPGDTPRKKKEQPLHKQHTNVSKIQGLLSHICRHVFVPSKVLHSGGPCDFVSYKSSEF